MPIQKIVIFISIGLIFLFGFFAGAFFRTIDVAPTHLDTFPASDAIPPNDDSAGQKDVPKDNLLKIDLSKKNSLENNDESSTSEKLDEENAKKIEQALQNPDFKRVHDFLQRENPIRMNIPELMPKEKE
ncbi:MAG: hypothetical protein ACRCUY_06835 [Thermoguttaceae bacterium]